MANGHATVSTADSFATVIAEIALLKRADTELASRLSELDAGQRAILTKLDEFQKARQIQPTHLITGLAALFGMAATIIVAGYAFINSGVQNQLAPVLADIRGNQVGMADAGARLDRISGSLGNANEKLSGLENRLREQLTEVETQVRALQNYACIESASVHRDLARLSAKAGETPMLQYPWHCPTIAHNGPPAP